MYYRTKTYIAADWSGDEDAINKLYEWNDNDNLSLSFTDAHELTQSKDESLNCSIKASLSLRLSASKTFVLIVGDKTKSVTSGSCRHCGSYNSYTQRCARWHNVDFRSYVEYECEKAIKAGLNIVVLYNDTSINKSKCPNIIRNYGKHVAMICYKDREYYWDYQAVKRALS